jgi:hypothetical protein
MVPSPRDLYSNIHIPIFHYLPSIFSTYKALWDGNSGFLYTHTHTHEKYFLSGWIDIKSGRYFASKPTLVEEDYHQGITFNFLRGKSLNFDNFSSFFNARKSY